MHCNLRPREPRQSFLALITTSCHVWRRWTYPLPYYSVFTADTLSLRCDFDLWPCDLDLWPLALNICSVSFLTRWNSVPNLNAIERSVAELLRFQCSTLWPWTCFKCCARLWGNFHQVWPWQFIRAWIIAFFDADTLCQAVTLTFDILILNFYITWMSCA